MTRSIYNGDYSNSLIDSVKIVARLKKAEGAFDALKE